ncbi:MAG: hypothetical protein HC848_02675 [Limnobacter sp.]|nr:hypothetical protein [Limnobacter sp.]
MKKTFSMVVCGILAAYGLNAAAAEQTASQSQVAAVQFMSDADLASTQAGRGLTNLEQLKIGVLKLLYKAGKINAKEFNARFKKILNAK